MKNYSSYISEKFLIGDDNIKIQNYDYHPQTKDELIKILLVRLNDAKDLTETIDLNNIDTSKIADFSFLFYNNSRAVNIDISYWDTQKVKSMNGMFASCINLKSIGDISNWNVKNLKLMKNTFAFCKNLHSVGDIENWQVRSDIKTDNAFTKSGLPVPTWANR